MERAHHAAIDGDPTPPERPVRRTFIADHKARILAEYEASPTDGTRGSIVRREGLYGSHIIDWWRARDAAILDGLAPRPRPRMTSPEQLEIERLRRRAEKAEAELAKARLVIDSQGVASDLLGRLLAEADEEPRQPR